MIKNQKLKIFIAYLYLSFLSENFEKSCGR